MLIAYFTRRYKATQALKDSAGFAEKAFHGKIMDGEVRIVELQISSFLNLDQNEHVFLLDAHKKTIFPSGEALKFQNFCPKVNDPCVKGFGEYAEILIPIYYDEKNESLFGYLYISRNLHPEWLFIIAISLTLGLSLILILLGVTQTTQSAVSLIAADLNDWSVRLSADPKAIVEISEVPFRELSPLKAAIEGLNKKIERYEDVAAEEAKLLILRGIAHDLLNPIAQVRMALATLKVTARGNTSLIPTIEASIDAISRVSSLAAQVKVLRELPTSTEEKSNLALTVKSEVETFGASEPFQRNAVMLHVADNCLKSAVPYSSSEISRVLQNLIENAIHASENGSPIEISIYSEDSKIVLSIADSGRGIPLEFQQKVFQPDFSLKKENGTGLGLSIVRSIITARGGEILLESSPGVGTTFRLKMPLVS